ncbi:hypothetical protein GGX14DRAFT_572855 [Mycena pura]|uniref:Uncharacterized protein n=1 Tax=Mycena pura TaxID=153505 RepID=A0AAD6V4A7_9AGAR|nr:hypothetical protein GGX14DRAFT_572855 [Mycena pura]
MGRTLDQFCITHFTEVKYKELYSRRKQTLRTIRYKGGIWAPTIKKIQITVYYRDPSNPSQGVGTQLDVTPGTTDVTTNQGAVVAMLEMLTRRFMGEEAFKRIYPNQGDFKIDWAKFYAEDTWLYVRASVVDHYILVARVHATSAPTPPGPSPATAAKSTLRRCASTLPVDRLGAGAARSESTPTPTPLRGRPGPGALSPTAARYPPHPPASSAARFRCPPPATGCFPVLQVTTCHFLLVVGQTSDSDSVSVDLPHDPDLNLQRMRRGGRGGVWVLWFFESRDTLAAEPEALQQHFTPLLLLFVCAPFRYASTLASPHHYPGSQLPGVLAGVAGRTALCAAGVAAVLRVHTGAAMRARWRVGTREGIQGLCLWGRRRRTSTRRTQPPPAAILHRRDHSLAPLLKVNNPCWPTAQKRVVVDHRGYLLARIPYLYLGNPLAHRCFGSSRLARNLKTATTTLGNWSRNHVPHFYLFFTRRLHRSAPPGPGAPTGQHAKTHPSCKTRRPLPASGRRLSPVKSTRSSTAGDSDSLLIPPCRSSAARAARARLAVFLWSKPHRPRHGMCRKAPTRPRQMPVQQRFDTCFGHCVHENTMAGVVRWSGRPTMLSAVEGSCTLCATFTLLQTRSVVATAGARNAPVWTRLKRLDATLHGDPSPGELRNREAHWLNFIPRSRYTINVDFLSAHHGKASCADAAIAKLGQNKSYVVVACLDARFLCRLRLFFPKHRHHYR